MKYVVLSADNELKVYLVPDSIAESKITFFKRCYEFSMNWKDRLIHPKDWYDEKDFIEFLNAKICKDEKCVYVESIGWDYERKKWPEKYQKCYWYAF